MLQDLSDDVMLHKMMSLLILTNHSASVCLLNLVRNAISDSS